MFLISFIGLSISVILIILNSFLASKSSNDREKLTPFECGFNPQFFSRTPFSMQFFLIAIIFLIFDVEITLIMPIPLISLVKTMNAMTISASFFILILIMGLYHEWIQGALHWPK